MKWVFWSLTAVFFVAVTGALVGLPGCDWAVRLQAVPAILSLDLVALAVFVALTAFYGRFFCRVMCPLGILQSVVARVTHFRRPIKRVCTRLPQSRAQWVVRLAILAFVLVAVASGLGVALAALDPYAIYARFVTWVRGRFFAPDELESVAFAAWSIGLFSFVMALAAIGTGRIWCNWICPVGTVLDFCSRISWRHDEVGSCCGNCRKCFK